MNIKLQKSKQSGFTLIELIIVIIILGVLSTTALPKFLNFSSDANKAVLQAMGGTILSFSTQVYAKAVITNQQNKAATNIDLDGDNTADIAIVYGYPSGTRNGNGTASGTTSVGSVGIAGNMGSSFETDWAWSANNNNSILFLTTSSIAGTSGQKVNRNPISITNCYLTYTQSSGVGELPEITYFLDDC